MDATGAVRCNCDQQETYTSLSYKTAFSLPHSCRSKPALTNKGSPHDRHGTGHRWYCTVPPSALMDHPRHGSERLLTTRGGGFPQGCVRTAVNRRRSPPPPLFPFQCLRLTATILLRRLRHQENLSLKYLEYCEVSRLRQLILV